jgi:hypothetical protein
MTKQLHPIHPMVPHPMVPPNILLNNWESDWFAERESISALLTQAYQAGADAELEACCEWLQDPDLNVDTYKLRAARRPSLNPPSLRHRALNVLRNALAPPPELIGRWEEDWHHSKVKHIELKDHIATQAAQWGADQELEACCAWADETGWQGLGDGFRAARRPKPPSLKKQALAIIDECTDPEGDYLDDNALSIIRQALEALPD